MTGAQHRPRTYPPAFGRRLAHLHKRFCRERVVAHDMPKGMHEMSLPGFFRGLEWADLWEDANLVSVLQYIRASVHLNLGEYRALFPQEL